MTERLSGAESLLRVLVSAGTRHVFGLPGVTSARILDQLVVHPELQYILGKHEGPVVAMADGYAKITGRPAVACLYGIAGVGNAISLLYDTHKDRTPLVVIASQQDQGLRLGTESVVEGDVVPLVQQFTRYATEVNRVDRIADSVARAFKTAAAPPAPGPTLVSVPMNLLGEDCDVEVPDVSRLTVSTTMLGDPAQLEHAIHLLAHAKHPLILGGSQVTRHGAVAELVELAELLAAPVAYENFYNDRLCIPASHECALGDFYPTHPDVQAADVVLGVGCRLHHQVHRAPEPLLPRSAKLVHVNLEPELIGMTTAVDAAIVADPRSALRALIAGVRGQLDSTVVERRRAERRERNAAQRAAVTRWGRQGWDDAPIKSWRIVQELDEVVGAEAVFVAELTSYQRIITRFLQRVRPERFFADTGGCLGWGLGAAAGMKLARPESPVVCCVGDGAFLFGLQALWSIANYAIPTVTIVFNNGGYFSTRRHTENLRRHTIETGTYVAGDMADDPTDCAKIAEGFGIWGRRIDRPEAFRPALEEALASGRPAVLDVRVSRDSATLSAAIPGFP